jgi:hypothetical protein
MRDFRAFCVTFTHRGKGNTQKLLQQTLAKFMLESSVMKDQPRLQRKAT